MTDPTDPTPTAPLSPQPFLDVPCPHCRGTGQRALGPWTAVRYAQVNDERVPSAYDRKPSAHPEAPPPVYAFVRGDERLWLAYASNTHHTSAEDAMVAADAAMTAEPGPNAQLAAGARITLQIANQCDALREALRVAIDALEDAVAGLPAAVREDGDLENRIHACKQTLAETAP